jgi:thymidylate synthase (FAD)
MILLKPSFEVLCLPFGNPAIFIEHCGRVCYKSEDKITDDSAVKFCTMLNSKQHESVFEHVTATVRFIANRGFTHELVRHRLASYSQESTRYCNYGKKGVRFIIPSWIDLPEGEYGNGIPAPKQYTAEEMYWLDSMHKAEFNYNKLLELGQSPQQARGVLPIDLKTEIIMTANIREWKHVFKLRCSGKAHPQMQELMRPLYEEFNQWFPEYYADLLW